MRGVNTAIGPDERNSIWTAALAGISERVSGECKSFLYRVIAKLGRKLDRSIRTVADLISAGLNNARPDAYAAINLPSGQGLNKRGTAFAKTEGNTIFLGENFFDATLPNSYNKQGGDQTATVIHEFFHLSAVASNGPIIEDDLNNAVGGGFGAFGEQMRTNCGPKR